jgi:hypothetical protein
MAAYATRAELAAYPDPPAGADAELDALLELATLDVDALLGPRRILTTGAYAGRKVDPTTLAEWARVALSRAVCGQAAYLATVPEAERAGYGAGTVKGPDFEVTGVKSDVGGRPRFGPRAIAELAPVRPFLAVTTARVTA